MTETLKYESAGDVGILRLDDGKANALSPTVLAEINAGLDQAEEARQAIVLTGRPGKFSAGFDLGVMREGGPKVAQQMVLGGARLALRLARHPGPVVIACSGHALAMGGVLLLAADWRVGANGAFKIGFNEVAIGMATPIFLLEFARERIPTRHFQRATVQAQIYTPDEAIETGFLDVVVGDDQVFDVALGEAQRLAKLPRGPYLKTRALALADTLERIEETLEADIGSSFPS
jgi:enoyl-CoA hydratase